METNLPKKNNIPILYFRGVLGIYPYTFGIISALQNGLLPHQIEQLQLRTCSGSGFAITCLLLNIPAHLILSELRAFLRYHQRYFGFQQFYEFMYKMTLKFLETFRDEDKKINHQIKLYNYIDEKVEYINVEQNIEPAKYAKLLTWSAFIPSLDPHMMKPDGKYVDGSMIPTNKSNNSTEDVMNVLDVLQNNDPDFIGNFFDKIFYKIPGMFTIVDNTCCFERGYHACVRTLLPKIYESLGFNSFQISELTLKVLASYEKPPILDHRDHKYRILEGSSKLPYPSELVSNVQMHNIMYNIMHYITASDEHKSFMHNIMLRITPSVQRFYVSTQYEISEFARLIKVTLIPFILLVYLQVLRSFPIVDRSNKIKEYISNRNEKL